MKNRAIKAKNHAARVQKRAEKNKIRRTQMLKILRTNIKKKDKQLQWNPSKIVNQFLSDRRQNISEFSNDVIDTAGESVAEIEQNED